MQPREIIDQTQYERFEANRRFEEMTDIAERLGYPINTTISYEMRGGAAYCRSDTKNRPFHEQTQLAKLEGKTKFVGDQAFEYTRLSHEHDEALLVDQLGAGKLAGNVLIKVSKVPDAVARGETTIKGYRRDLLRSFVRIYYQTEDGLECKLFTLDKSSQRGLQAVGELLGVNTLAGSEEVLGSHAVLQVPSAPKQFVDELAKATISAYDSEIHQDTGRITYAGSEYSDELNAMNSVISQQRLVSEHMQTLRDVMSVGLDGDRLEDQLERQRQLTAAAVKLSTQGVSVLSSSDSHVAAEAATTDYGRECASAVGMNQAAQAMENKWSAGECQVCFVKTMVGSCAVCKNCAAADDRGVDLLKQRDQNLRRLRRMQVVQKAVTATPKRSEKPSKRQSIEAAYGKHVQIKTVRTIGGANKVAVYVRTGEIIDKAR